MYAAGQYLSMTAASERIQLTDVHRLALPVFIGEVTVRVPTGDSQPSHLVFIDLSRRDSP
jgi:hypothetical protein